ncbi:MAG: triose-phosphate isomerase [Desulfuromonas sp.]|nr:MAG: triose-phosphate isomerase [Desulfuromonas sp.]
MRTPIIAGNWKLHNTRDQAIALSTGIKSQTSDVTDVEIVVAPVFTALNAVADALRGSSIKVAAQNCYPQAQGAFTGEVSPQLVEDIGCNYVIIGHSERRQLFGEDDAFINRKVHALAETGLGTILCIGETLAERESGQMFNVLRRQVCEGLKGLGIESMVRVVIAYEPVWAIGTGKTASDQQAQESHAFIRSLLDELYGAQVAGATRILYGGSVKPDNVDGLMAQPDVDGALVGGASLKPADFVRIIKFQKV